jgi:hypothetical protein
MKDAPEAPPETANTFIACELHDKASLTTMAGRYTALSYCAGSSAETTKIMINGMWFNAFANLEHALESFRKHSQESEVSKPQLLIWTDQVCINQSDHKEKSSQVALMRQIYHYAEHVFICLSTTSNTRAVLTATPKGVYALKHMLHESFTSISPESRTTVYHPKILLCHLTELLNSDAGLSQLKVWFEFLLHVVSVPWWTRAWVSSSYPSYHASAAIHTLVGLPGVYCCLSCFFSMRTTLSIMARNLSVSYTLLL